MTLQVSLTASDKEGSLDFRRSGGGLSRMTFRLPPRGWKQQPAHESPERSKEQ